MPDNFTWILFARSLSGETTPEEEQQLQQLLQEDDNLCQQYDVLFQFWNNMVASEKDDAGDRRHIQQIIRKAEVPAARTQLTQIRRTKTRFVYGLMLLIAMCAGTLFLYFNHNHNNKILSFISAQQKITAKKGTHKKNSFA